VITLFAKSGCPYCAKALGALDAHGLSFIKKNIADNAVAEELVALGGKKQVPYLVDGNVAMYESDDIVEYLEKTYGGGTPAVPAPEIRIHKAGGACQS
jgi:glutathione S-transferase